MTLDSKAIEAHAWAEAVRSDFNGKPMWIWLADHPEATELFRALLTAYLSAAPIPDSGEGVDEATIEAVVAAVRPYTMETLFIDEHRDLVRRALSESNKP